MHDLVKIIEDTALRIPDLPALPRKNIFDILGVENKELNNSRFLGYFLNPDEEHGFEKLFFDSLLDVIDSKKTNHNPKIELENYIGDFTVNIEEQTIFAKNEENKQKRIDVFVKGKDWCIIIENKLYHHIANPLEVYWEHADKMFQKNKIGVLLTLFPKEPSECIVNNSLTYINITHQEWIEAIQNNLRFNTSINETDLFYLKEYLKTIESHYTYRMDEPKMNEVVNALVAQKEHLATIEQKKAKAIEFLNQEIETLFSEYGFEYIDKWYSHPKAEDVCFWVSSSKSIIEENKLWFCFEVWNKERKNIENTSLLESLEQQNISPKITHGNSDRHKTRLHIAKYEANDFFNGTDSFKEKFRSILNQYFFNKGGIVEQVEVVLDINTKEV